jgi:hypothetical protein
MAAEISTQDSEHRLCYYLIVYLKDANGYSIDLT